MNYLVSWFSENHEIGYHHMESRSAALEFQDFPWFSETYAFFQDFWGLKFWTIKFQDFPGSVWTLDIRGGGTSWARNWKWGKAPRSKKSNFRTPFFSRFQDIFVGFTRLKTQKLHVFSVLTNLNQVMICKKMHKTVVNSDYRMNLLGETVVSQQVNQKCW